MAHPKSKRMALRSAYCYKALSLEEAAALVGISIGTARRWKTDAQKAEDFDASDFVANTFDNEWGAKFKIDNNALYVMYTAIPEPAAVAALFGVLALGFALRRKRM